MMPRFLLLLGCLSALSALADPAGVGACAPAADNWPQWRGPLANGVAPRANPPVHWSETNNIRWKIPLPGKGHSSPIVFGDSVYLLSAVPVGEAQKPVYDDAPGAHDGVPVTHRHQFLALAINRRDEKTSWSTPLVVVHEGKPQVIVSATKRVRGYDLATGAQLWECAGLTDNVVSSPVYYNGIVVAGNSYYSQAMVAIRLAGAKGDVTGTDHVVWKLNRLTPYVSSPVLYDDTLYFLRHNQNVLSRLEPTTGKPRGEPLRLDGINDFIFSSPVGAAGRIYITSRDGTTVVLRHDRENVALAVNHLEDSFSASPAVVDREFYLRGERSLYCIAESGQTESIQLK